MNNYDRYCEFVKRLPPPGGGGAHQAIFAAGCLGARAGLSELHVIDDVQYYLPQGRRTVTFGEIREGIAAGFREVFENGVNKSVKPPVCVSPSKIEELVKSGQGTTVESIMARSPVLLSFPQEEAGWRTLETLYKPDDILYIGDDQLPGRPGSTVKSAREWIRDLKGKPVPFPKIIANPLSGKPAPTKANPDKLTYRGDGNVVQWRFMLVEFDGMTFENQLAFWAVSMLPVAALVVSGGKSIHGWVQVDCESKEEWDREIEQSLFPSYLVPLGVDGACKNEARLSRLPGHVRKDTGRMQQLIYLSPEGKAVAA